MLETAGAIVIMNAYNGIKYFNWSFHSFSCYVTSIAY